MTILKRKIFKKNILSFFVLISLCVSASLRLICPDEANAQVRVTYDYGAIGLAQILKRLNTTASVMHIGAHPDDEDSGLLSFLARGENARTAYLSLTRGDGGQNLIGSEQSEALGVIRTEELLQARRLDGAEQYFTRAFDFGFSKTLAETKEKWDEKVILCDAVRAIRLFRPLVVISRFTGTPADGHGHHQFAGYIAPLAVKAAADPTQCKDTGHSWQVLKFYVSQGFRDTSQPTLRINTGKYDPLLGRSYFEIAMEGRSQHKTQEQGILELKGEQFSGLNLMESNVPKVEKETSVFDGIDVSIRNLWNLIGIGGTGSEDVFAEIQSSAVDVLSNYNALDQSKIITPLTKGLRAIGREKNFTRETKINARSRFRSFVFFLNEKEKEFSEAIRLASGITLDALADRETVVPGEDFTATVKVFFPNVEAVKVKEIKLKAPDGWTITKTEEPKNATQSFRRETANQTEYFNVGVSSSANLTEPYWLEDPRDGNLYRWNDDANQTLPFQSPLITASVKIDVGGTEITLNQPIEYRFADDIRGEIRRELNIVPALSVSLDQKLLIVPNSEKAQTRRVVMSLTNHSTKPVSGVVGLNIVGMEPIDWKYSVSSRSFNLKTKGEKTAITFDITIPAKTKAGEYRIYAQAMVGESLATTEMNTLAYPHIQTHRFYTRAETKVEVLDLKTAPVKIGYIAGSGDRVAEAIRQMNFDVEMLNENDLTSGDLIRFDVIVVGIRASLVRADFVANHQRLLDYVKNGGTLLVQYQPPTYQNLLPFPAQMGARVVDENAKVTILNAQSPIFNFPNKITEEDFKGWIQERNLNNFTTFDAKYTPLLESHDAGEAENKGGLVVAEIGKGKYIYCSYAFFRQLPAGVPGAYRLFANLLSLPKAKK
jgi:LmbE family N-acetylglucosaminyl deacetylase